MLHRGRPGGKLAASAVCLCLLLALLHAGAGQAAAELPVVGAQVADAPSGQAIAPGFLGISFEYRAMRDYTGRDPTHVNPVLVALLRGLAPRGASVLRIGGNSTDQTWWPMRGVIPPGGINYALTEGWLRTTRALSQTLGAKLILGVNLAARRPALGAAEARALIAGIGRGNIQALEIGNEPDLYPVFAWYHDRLGRVVHTRGSQYNLASLISEFARWRAALPSVPLAGPTLSSRSWMGGLGKFISAQPGLAVVSFHRYPLRACVNNPADPSFASIGNLLAETSSAGLAAGVAPYVPVAHQHGLPFRLDELNSAACTGRRGLSDTFAAALWMLDTLFSMASVGIDGVNLHTLPRAPYEPFSFSHDGAGWHAVVHPSYYGALMFTRAFPAGAKLLSVSAPAGPVKIWATRGTDGRTRVAVINKSATQVLINLQLPGPQTRLSSQALSAPSLAATGGVTLAGQTFGERTDTGLLSGSPGGAVIDSLAGAYAVPVAPESAVLLTR